MLAAGTRLGPYEIQTSLGAGGMGEVYRARDTRLGRIVAIKLLPEPFADRPDRRQRFEREARSISALSHPHICTLYDVGEVGDVGEHRGLAFLVMEYVDGETLDDRLSRGPLPADEVIRYAGEIAAALEHAHQAAIVHRDLKPSNVMLSESGAKLLDFGLAHSPSFAAVDGSSTLSFEQRPLTAEGTIIGTFRYMAPEQLEGRSVDARTDIFAFGALLYEMATGEHAFDGSSRASLIASILTGQPAPLSPRRSARRADGLPPAFEHVVERCLAKDPDERWQSARDIRLELSWIRRHPASDSRPVVVERRRRRGAWTVTAVLLAVGAATIGAYLGRDDPSARLVRFVIDPPPGTLIGAPQSRPRLAISPDGQRLAFVASRQGRQHIWIRPLEAIEATPLAGTEGGVAPFWSPDSRFVGFFVPGEGTLKKIEVSGGLPRTICSAEVDGVPAWGPDGTILFTQFRDGLFRVSADGGTPTRATIRDLGSGEMNHYWPSYLPDGRHFLYLATARDASGLRVTPSVYVASLDGPERRLLARVHSRMMFAPPGHLLFVEAGTLVAQPFDIRGLRMTGEPLTIAEGVANFQALGNAGFTVSDTGALAYLGNTDSSQLVWYDRQGNPTESGWERQNFAAVRISPDGRSVAADVVDPRTGMPDIWIYDVVRGAPVRFTTLGDESRAVWSPDGRRLLFRTGRGGAPDLLIRSLGESGAGSVIADLPEPLDPDDWSPDDRWIAFTATDRSGGADVLLLPVAGDGNVRPLSNTRFEEWGARFSPDSLRVAFVSDESGVAEVYVAPVERSGDRTRISVGGGTTPRWRADGREVFYVASDNRSIMAVPVMAGPTFRVGAPRRLFTIRPDAAAGTVRQMVFDVSRDGQRFLTSVATEEPGSSRVTVVLNWPAALRR